MFIATRQILLVTIYYHFGDKFKAIASSSLNRMVKLVQCKDSVSMIGTSALILSIKLLSLVLFKIFY